MLHVYKWESVLMYIFVRMHSSISHEMSWMRSGTNLMYLLFGLLKDRQRVRPLLGLKTRGKVRILLTFL